MPLPVKLNDVVEALASAMEEHDYYLDKRTGEIVLITDDDRRAAEKDELVSEYPKWQRESILKAREILKSEADFIQLPDNFDIHEYRIMEDFCFSFEDRRVGENLRRLIKGSGAFRRFKHAIHSMGIEKSWYEFKRAKLEEMAIEWLEEQEIPYTRDEASAATGLSM